MLRQNTFLPSGSRLQGSQGTGKPGLPYSTPWGRLTIELSKTQLHTYPLLLVLVSFNS